MGVTNYLTVNGEILSETRNGISTDYGVVKTQWFTISTSTSDDPGQSPFATEVKTIPESGFYLPRRASYPLEPYPWLKRDDPVEHQYIPPAYKTWLESIREEFTSESKEEN